MINLVTGFKWFSNKAWRFQVVPSFIMYIPFRELGYNCRLLNYVIERNWSKRDISIRKIPKAIQNSIVFGQMQKKNRFDIVYSKIFK